MAVLCPFSSLLVSACFPLFPYPGACAGVGSVLQSEGLRTVAFGGTTLRSCIFLHAKWKHWKIKQEQFGGVKHT